MGAKQRQLELLRTVPLFGGLRKRELTEIRRVCREIEFSAGDRIVEAGSVAMDFYLILDGHARLTVPRRKTVELGPGDYFGEISVLDGGPRTANVTALTNVVALRIEREDFVPLLDRFGSIGRKILVVMCGRLRSAEGSRLH